MTMQGQGSFSVLGRGKPALLVLLGRGAIGRSEHILLLPPAVLQLSNLGIAVTPLPAVWQSALHVGIMDAGAIEAQETCG
jgi:hypothetical protein